MKYLVIIKTSSTKWAYGPFDTLPELKEWLKDRIDKMKSDEKYEIVELLPK